MPVHTNMSQPHKCTWIVCDYYEEWYKKVHFRQATCDKWECRSKHTSERNKRQREKEKKRKELGL